MRGVIVGRRGEPTFLVLSTYLFYDRPDPPGCLGARRPGAPQSRAGYLLSRTAAGAART